VSYLFTATDIRKRYGGRQVLLSAGLWVRAGSISVLLGRNGGGKTTLVELALGWRRGESGVVTVGPERLVRPSLAHLARRGVFYLPQQSWLSPVHAVRTHFDAVAHVASRDSADNAIERMRVGEFLDRQVNQLSGGERRRVELALAVARRPTCLIADEPFLGIAPQDAELVGSIFREMAAAGCGVFVTGHEVATLLDLADYVIWLIGGTTHDLGTVEAALAHRQFAREYLGPAGARPSGAPNPSRSEHRD
jgi:ABC-type multidrug transport system ATPase subunit